ncbi:DUF4178 domain-containing protein [Novosphingobium sp. B 225]|uniref:DUF4178 domain-containing protein n=1 Tax=Novosphingobium sp. B 225 TaxID=1961849 RepID=UPI000B4BFD55|nr:DUF4178 domain-containing protein [Novosphingobium sp. B 225]
MSAARSVTCPNCGGTIAVKAAGYSVSVGCQHCGALLDVAHPDVAVIEQYEGTMRELPVPLGRRGVLFGTEWEAIGALARSDGDVDWTETLLFNPYVGYRWLVLSEGEWTFGTMLIDRPSGSGGSTLWRGSRYSQDYDPADTVTTQVVGEFYWRVRAGDTVSATTYSRGQELLSAEWSADEVNWTQLIPLGANEVEQAFGLGMPSSGGPRPSFGRRGLAQGLAAPQGGAGPADDEGLAGKLGTSFAQAEPMAHSDLPKMFGLAFATLMLSMLVMIGFGISTATVRSSTSVVVGGPEVTVTVGKITVGRSYQPVTIEARASNFNNRWIDIDYTLVDRATQRGYTAYGVVEYYTGYDSDGAWSEGDFRTTTKFSGVPRGTYDIVADLQAHPWGSASYSRTTSSANAWMLGGAGAGPQAGDRIAVDLIASAGGVMWGNLWLELAALLGVPLLILWWRHQNDDDDDD